MNLERPILLYDGICGLCNRVVRFVTNRDRADKFRFAPLQGGLAADILTRQGIDPGRLDTIFVVIDRGLPTERLLSKARAALFVARELGAPWSAVQPLGILPDRLLNLGYDLVARFRYKIFGKHDQCPLPNPADRHKFLDA